MLLIGFLCFILTAVPLLIQQEAIYEGDLSPGHLVTGVITKDMGS